MYEYDLFAVINHEGQINNGHYTNFARFQDEVSMIYWTVLMTPSALINYFVLQWYRFDDDKYDSLGCGSTWEFFLTFRPLECPHRVSGLV